ncbi:2,3-butanediol dehydrogenase [Solibacillus cecembensis]|uniref:2,3-butanediol dehydrogenase n=1 Tax=Solibacillus cecembensis TaxID=459347 RepID=UPI003D01FC76
MKAAVLHNANDLRIEEVNKPQHGPDQVLIEVAWAGICGSDLAVYQYGLGENIHPLTGRKAPLTLGHEFAGTLVAIGENVDHFQVGDHVTVEPLIFCGTCPACNSGYYNQCQMVGFIGLNTDGGFAQYVVVDASKLHKLPDNVSLEEGALVEPTAVSFYAVRESKLKTGDTAIIYGAGPIGLLTLICVKAAGAAKIIVVDISEERLQKAQQLGATMVLRGDQDDLIPTILSATNGGADVIYDCAGAQQTINNVLYTTKLGAQIMIIATFKKPIEIDVNLVMFKALHITSTLAYRNVFPTVIDLIAAGQLDVKPVITHKIAIDDLVEEGFEKLLHDKSQAKILVTPTSNH